MDLVRHSLAIVFVFGLLWTALWFVRKKGWTSTRRSKAPPGLLESRGKLALTPLHSIHLVRIGDRTLAIALHPKGVTLLGDAGAANGHQREQRAAL